MEAFVYFHSPDAVASSIHQWQLPKKYMCCSEGGYAWVLTEVSMGTRWSLRVLWKFFFFCSEGQWMLVFCYCLVHYFHENRYSVRRGSLALSIETGSTQLHNPREKLLCVRQFASVCPGLFTMCLSLYFTVREELMLLHWPCKSLSAPIPDSFPPAHVHSHFL